MGFNGRARIHTAEILDAGTAPPADVRESLADIRRVNAWLGGRRVLRILLNEQLHRKLRYSFLVLL